MSCEEININRLSKGELEKHYRLHLFAYLNSNEREEDQERRSIDKLQRSYVANFGSTAWVLFTNITMRDYERKIEKDE